jgi:hypothetical protein
MPTLILGGTGSGKTTALMRRYYEWIRGGARTDQVLVLTAGAAHSSFWRKNLKMEAHGPIEAHSFFGFIQRELNLFWAPVQAALPQLKAWVRPEFLNVEIAHHLMRGLVEPREADFTAQVKASPQRIAIQIASNLSTVAAASGLSPGEMARRLAAADREEKAPLYEMVHALLENFREQCLAAGILDYGLSLHLFTGVLMQHGPYLDHLRAQYRYLLVDDLDESVPAEQDFLAALTGQMEQAVLAFGIDGGHGSFMGADPTSALQRFRPGAQEVELTGSYTCSAEAFDFGQAMNNRIMGKRPERRFTGIVEERIAMELRGDMIEAVVEKVIALVDRGVPPGEIALISPHVDRALEVTANRTLGARAIPVQNLSLSRRLVDEPYARAIITLAGLVYPHWKIPHETAGSFTNAMQLLLKLDPIRASILGDAIWRPPVELPDLDATGLRRRIGFERAEAYEYLKKWVHDAQKREMGTDEFAQAVVSEVMAPLVGDELTTEKLHACQQLLLSAHRFRQAMERFGDGAYGSEYVKMLTEGTVAAEPLEAYDPAKDAITLATPFSYLTSRLTSQYQIWVDISGDGWYPNDVKELANPHVLSRRWEEGDRWTDTRNNRIRQANAARTVRALIRRCRGRLILAECSLTPWGQEQEGGLSEAFGDLIREKAAK